MSEWSRKVSSVLWCLHWRWPGDGLTWHPHNTNMSPWPPLGQPWGKITFLKFYKSKSQISNHSTFCFYFFFFSFYIYNFEINEWWACQCDINKQIIEVPYFQVSKRRVREGIMACGWWAGAWQNDNGLATHCCPDTRCQMIVAAIMWQQWYNALCFVLSIS